LKPPRSEWRITTNPGGGFSLADPAGEFVCGSADPRALSRHAFARGADAVRHDYDLALAP